MNWMMVSGPCSFGHLKPPKVPPTGLLKPLMAMRGKPPVRGLKGTPVSRPP